MNKKKFYISLLCCVHFLNLTLSAQKPTNQSKIDISGSHNIVIVIQGENNVTYDRNDSAQFKKLNNYLSSQPQASKFINKVEGGNNDFENLVRGFKGSNNENGQVLDVGEFFKMFQKVIEDKIELKSELDRLRAENKNSNFDTVLKQANEYLIAADYENYKKTLRDFKRIKKESIAKEQKNYSEAAYLLSLRELAEYDIENALININEALGYSPINYDYLYIKAKIFLLSSQFDKSISILKDLLNRNPSIDAQWLIYEGLFNSYIGLNDYFESTRYLDLSLDIINKGYKKDYDVIASIFYKQASLASKLGNHEEAIKHFDSSLVYAIQTPDKKLYEAFIYSGKGLSLSYIGRTKEALGYLDSALAIRVRIYGKSSMDVAYIYNNIATAYNQAEEYHNAILYDSLAMDVQRNFLSGNSAQYAGTLKNLGFAYTMLKDSLQADKYLSQALKISETTLGINHPEYAIILTFYGHLYTAFMNFDKAIASYKNALKIQINTLGLIDMDVFQTYCAMGNLFNLYGFYDDSIKAYERALSIVLMRFGDKSTFAIDVTKNLDEIRLKNTNNEVK